MDWVKLKSSIFVISLLIYGIGYGQPPGSSIDFTASKVDACSPAIITFQAQNVSSSSKVDWVVSGDTFSSRKKLRKLFIKKGLYDITMVVNKSDGTTDKKIKSKFIDIDEKPSQIKLNPSDDLLCNGPETVSFKASGKNVQKWNWVVENKRLSDTTSDIKQKFESTGYKDVTLKAISRLGCKNVKTFDSAVFIRNSLNAVFNTDDSKGFSTHEVNFKAQDSGPKINKYDWQFPGANKSKDVSINPAKKHYQNSGTYDVVLQLTTNRGCHYQNKKANHIIVGDSLNLKFDLSSNRVCPNEPFQVINKTNHKCPGSFKWKFKGPDTKVFKDKPRLTTSFEEPGEYDIRLIHEVNGLQQVVHKENAVNVINLKADFSASSLCHCDVPTTIKFSNKSKSPTGVTPSYDWTFFDKNGQVIKTSSNKNPNLTYAEYGEYDVRLITSYNNGCSDTAFKKDYIKLEPLKDEIQLALKTYAVNTPLKIDFPEDSFCSKDSLRVHWTIYNEKGTQVVKTSKQRNPSMTFKDSGTYRIKLSVSTKSGCNSVSNSINATKVIKTFKPKPSIKDTSSNKKFAGPAHVICAGNAVTLEEQTYPKVLNYDHKWTIRHQKDPSQTYEGWGKTITKKIDTPGLYDVYYQAFVDSVNSFDTLYKGFISVRGAEVSFTEEVKQHCLPYKSNVLSQLNSDYTHPSNTKREYQWKTPAKKGITLKNAKKKQVEVLMGKAGRYDLALTITDKKGCETELKEPDFIDGGLKADFNLPANGCYDAGSSVPNQSFEGSSQVNYKWNSLDKDMALLKRSSVKDQKVRFNDSGLFKLRLSMENQYGCRDTQTQTIKVERVFIDFKAEDTLFYCAPSVADFKVNNSHNVEQYHWDFGDGSKQKTTKTNISHAYNKNSGGKSSGYDVKLTGESSNGCSKTVQKEQYVTVIGPVPDFKINKKNGCENLNVSFKKTGKHYAQSYMDYGDKSNVDSSETFTNQFKANTGIGQVSTYRPIMVAKDSLGCYAMKKADTPVRVFKKPDAKFTMDTINGCEPLKVAFKDQTALPVKTKWDFDSDGQVESKNAQPKNTFEKGSYDINLTVKTKHGCRDTNVKPDALKVLETPEVDFIGSDSIICPDESITFKRNITGDVPIEDLMWEIEEANSLDTVSDQQRVTIQYPESGNYDVNLTATNEKGCTGSIRKPDYVTSLDKIQEEPAIKYVTSKRTAKRKIEWEVSQAKGYSSYRLKRDKGFGEGLNKDEVTFYERPKTSFSHSVNNQKVAKDYQLYLKGQCGFYSDTSEEHRIPELTVKSDSVFTNDLSWKPYKGWKTVSAYKILRSVEGGSWEKIAMVNGNERQYRDRSLCRKNYSYQVVAVNEQKAYESYSNVASQTPEYRDSYLGDNLTRATVKDGDVKVEWKKPDKWQPNKYEIARKVKGENRWELRYKSVDGNSFIDKKAEVTENTYQYRIRAVNHCEALSNYSNKATAIHLNAIASDKNVQLKWADYNNWKSGVGSYKIQVNRENNGFKTIGEVSGNQTKFTDSEINPDVDSAYEYRVIAFNESGTVHSVSSKAWAVMPSEVYLPNAFSPNGDGLNEEFGIVGNSIGNFKGHDIKQFKLTIYNKWGELIFKSNKADNGWDGTTNKGEKAPLGNYVYKIKAHGLDGKAYFLDGSVQLVR